MPGTKHQHCDILCPTTLSTNNPKRKLWLVTCSHSNFSSYFVSYKLYITIVALCLPFKLQTCFGLPKVLLYSFRSNTYCYVDFGLVYTFNHKHRDLLTTNRSIVIKLLMSNDHFYKEINQVSREITNRLLYSFSVNF